MRLDVATIVEDIKYRLSPKFSKYRKTLDFYKMNHKRVTRRENKTKIVIS